MQWRFLDIYTPVPADYVHSEPLPRCASQPLQPHLNKYDV